jgi:hypothetical protein
MFYFSFSYMNVFAGGSKQMEPEKNSIFISYAKQDSKIAEKLYNDLKNAGAKPWLDKKDILPGQNRKREIKKAIEKCTHFLALLSSGSMTQRGFVHKEQRMALEILDQLPGDSVYIYPVRLDECTSFEDKLEEIEPVDLFPSYQEGRDRLLAVLPTAKNMAEKFPPAASVGNSGYDSSSDTPGTIPSSTPETHKKNDIFISYSHKDEEWKDRMVTQLMVLQMQQHFSLWEDRQIQTGDSWLPEIENALDQACVVVMMISANFLSSNFILQKEVPRILERRQKEGVRVIPIIVKPCPWRGVEWLSSIQLRPKDGVPLISGNEYQIEQELADIAEIISGFVKAANQNR